MPALSPNLVLSRCPHCAVANPNLSSVHRVETNSHDSTWRRFWIVYSCGSCDGLVTAWASSWDSEVQEFFPTSPSVKDDIPERPRTFLQQAFESMHAPAGAVMLAASAVDSMLKLKGYTDGSLYTRIEKAVNEHLITKEMAQWAHEVRLDSNDQRHADEVATFPTADEAKRAIDFATALAEFLFVLPSRVQRALSNAPAGGP